MTLTPEQKQAVASWVAAGDNLSTIQRKLTEQFNMSLTYRDVRFLVDDLNLELKDPAPKADVPDVNQASIAKGGPSRPDSPEQGRRAEPPGKRGLLDKLKEKVGIGPETEADEDELAPEALEDAAAEDYPPPAPAGAGGVTVDLDRIVRPGFVVSGTVTFTDGVSGKWALDQLGRLLLETPQKGYKPGPADVQAFQRALQVQLQRQGY